jgi:multidrug efflux pump
MAIAISCGLTVATLITLVVMPVIYCMVFKVKNEEQ